MNIKDLMTSISKINDNTEFPIDVIGKVDLKASSKKEGHSAYKISRVYVKKGLDYSELESTKKKIEEGYELFGKLPWGEWSTESGEENLIINHKDKKYLRVYPTSTKSETSYFLDGKVISRDDLEKSNLVLPSFFKSKPTTEVLNLNIENIISL